MERYTLKELYTEVTRMDQEKNDLIGPANRLTYNENAELVLPDSRGYTPTNIAHQQMSTVTGIPSRYYQRLLESNKPLLAQNVNHWLSTSNEDRMVRLLGTNFRALLSSSYRPLDNLPVLQAALTAFQNLSGDIYSELQVRQASLTERKMYLQVVFPRLQVNLGNELTPDVHMFGLTLSNSEVGLGYVLVESFIWRLVCSNGMIRSHALKKRHVGRRSRDINEEFADIYKSDTIEADSRAFKLRLRDAVHAAIDPQRFDADVAALSDARKDSVNIPNVTEVFERVSKRYTLASTESETILTNFIAGLDNTRFGLANAITRTARDTQSVDRQIELERVGSDIIDLDPSSWKTINA